MSKIYHRDIEEIKKYRGFILLLCDLGASVLKTLLLILLINLKTSSFALQSFDATNVCINLKKSLQPDSLGYNIPSELPKLFYNKIIDGTITLYDSPLKEVRVSAEVLQAIEMSTGTQFSSIENLFIHEIWEFSKRYLDTKTIGFSFINKSEKGPINYGFVDYREVVTFLDNNNIPVNANGFLNTSFRDAIQSKQFNFSIIQFGADDFRENPNEAFDIQKQLFNNPKVKLFNAPTSSVLYKSLSYEIDKLGTENNEAIFSSLTGFFQDNMQDFFNLGGDAMMPFLKKEPRLNFTKIKISELYKWEKGKITSEITSIQIYMYGKYLPVTDIEKYSQIGITVKFKPIAQFISQKDYAISITSINAETRNDMGEESKNIIRKLNEGKWNSLVEH